MPRIQIIGKHKILACCFLTDLHINFHVEEIKSTLYQISAINKIFYKTWGDIILDSRLLTNKQYWKSDKQQKDMRDQVEGIHKAGVL